MVVNETRNALLWFVGYVQFWEKLLDESEWYARVQFEVYNTEVATELWCYLKHFDVYRWSSCRKKFEFHSSVFMEGKSAEDVRVL